MHVKVLSTPFVHWFDRGRRQTTIMMTHSLSLLLIIRTVWELLRGFNHIFSLLWAGAVPKAVRDHKEATFASSRGITCLSHPFRLTETCVLAALLQK